MSAPHLRYFGLEATPFALTPDTSFFFAMRGTRRR